MPAPRGRRRELVEEREVGAAAPGAKKVDLGVDEPDDHASFAPRFPQDASRLHDDTLTGTGRHLCPAVGIQLGSSSWGITQSPNLGHPLLRHELVPRSKQVSGLGDEGLPCRMTRHSVVEARGHEDQPRSFPPCAVDGFLKLRVTIEGVLVEVAAAQIHRPSDEGRVPVLGVAAEHRIRHVTVDRKEARTRGLERCARGAHRCPRPGAGR